MTSIRKAFPTSVRQSGHSLALGAGRLTAGLRAEPTFLMVGAQRCGTTSLFRALLSHPNILRPIMHKGVNYFDVNADKSWSWYLGHFPVARTAEWRTRSVGEPAVFEFLMQRPERLIVVYHNISPADRSTEPSLKSMRSLPSKMMNVSSVSL